MQKLWTRVVLACSLLVLVSLSMVNGQIRTAEQPPDIDKIIKQFAAKETEFQETRNYYTFRQEVRVQTIGGGNRPTGEYFRISDVVFDDSGKRSGEKIVRFPQSTLKELQITPTDLKDLEEIQTFCLTSKVLPKYLINYAGKEKIDEIDTYVFDVKPKSIPKYQRGGERVFVGRIWVDDQDLQIVKLSGKALPEGEERFPRFETYRENIDGKYWFPTYTFADDTLDFPSGAAIHMRMEVRYTNYKRFSSDVKIEIGADEDDSAPTKPKKK